MVNRLLHELYTQLNPLCCDSPSFLEQGPSIIQDFFSKEGFLEGINFKEPGLCHSRTKILGGEGKLVIRAMGWSQDYTLGPHEHHGRPCIELLVGGEMEVTNIKMHPEDDLYKASILDTQNLLPGSIAVVNPSITDIHSVYCREKCLSLHFYPKDEAEGVVYQLKGTTGLYFSKKVLLRDD